MKGKYLFFCGVFSFLGSSLSAQIDEFQGFELPVGAAWQMGGFSVQNTASACTGQFAAYANMQTEANSAMTYISDQFFNSEEVNLSYKLKINRDSGSFDYIISGNIKVEYQVNDSSWVTIQNINADVKNCLVQNLTIPAGVIKRGDQLKIRWVSNASKDYPGSTTTVYYHVYVDDISIKQKYKEFVIYTQPDATGDGTSWDSPMDMATALVWAQQKSLTGLWTEKDPLKIFAKNGVYHPKYDADKETFGDIPSSNAWKTFYLPLNVKLYGGFNGTETDISQRVLPKNHEYGSILSGDFNNDDLVKDTGNSVEISNTTDNALHVVIAEAPNYNVANVAEINGFVIKGGAAMSGTAINSVYNSINDYSGAGIYVTNTKPTFNNLSIINNVAIGFGAAINSDNSSITGHHILLKNNVAPNAAVMMNVNSGYNLSRVEVIRNYSVTGYSGIVSDNDGTGLDTTSLITNSLIANNYSKTKGALDFKDLRYPLYFTNATMLNNGLKNNNQGDIRFRNSIIWDDFESLNFTASHSFIKNRIGKDNGNIDGEYFTIDEVLKDPSNANYRLKKNSPVIGVGSLGYYSTSQTPNISTLTTDLEAFVLAKFDVDFGAYQYDESTLATIDQQPSSVKAFPIPFKNELTVKNNDVIEKLDVVDALGRLIVTKTINAKEASINTSTLGTGFYILKIYSNNKVESLKIIK